MKLSRYAALTVVSLGMCLAPVEPAFAKKDPSAKKDSSAPSGPGSIDKSFQISPKGLKWGLSLEGIAKIYDKVIEEEMLPLYRKAEPGLELDALSEEQKSRQGALRRSRVEFGSTPTGVDQSALKGEYSYKNSESMAVITLTSGTKRHFFFFNDRLWKIYDEHKLKAGGNLGENFQEAVKALAKRFGAAPKMITADYDKGRSFDEAEWRDPDKTIRAIDRGKTLGVVYAERRIHENLGQYRKNKSDDGSDAIDKDVANVTKKAEEPGKDKDKGKGKGKGKDGKDAKDAKAKGGK